MPPNTQHHPLVRIKLLSEANKLHWLDSRRREIILIKEGSQLFWREELSEGVN